MPRLGFGARQQLFQHPLLRTSDDTHPDLHASRTMAAALGLTHTVAELSSIPMETRSLPVQLMTLDVGSVPLSPEVRLLEASSQTNPPCPRMLGRDGRCYKSTACSPHKD